LFATIRFGTTDLVVILARIFRGLHRAEQLEARVRRYAAHLDAAPGMARSANKASAGLLPNRAGAMYD
jgi:hypothetical protein